MRLRFLFPLLLAGSVVCMTAGCGDDKKGKGPEDGSKPSLNERPAPPISGGPPAPGAVAPGGKEKPGGGKSGNAPSVQ